MKVKTLFFTMVLLVTFTCNLYALPCFQGSVSGSVLCQDGLGNNDFIDEPMAVNAQEFFGYDDWIWLEKYEAPDGDGPGVSLINFDYGWTVTPDDGWADSSGDWSFNSSVWDDFEDVMIVLKSGNTIITEVITEISAYFSGYLLDNEGMPCSGTWDTGDKDISHLTLYARGPAPVPEPSTLLLLGAGITGLAFYRRKKK